MNGIDRREFLGRAGAAAVALALPFRLGRAGELALPESTRTALESSPLVYISPLLADGKESRCHGEVWFFFDGGDVVIATSKDSW